MPEHQEQQATVVHLLLPLVTSIKPSNAVGECGIDVSIAAAVAQGATINVYFTENSEAGWEAFLNRAILPPAGDSAPSVLSASWLLSFQNDPRARDLSRRLPKYHPVPESPALDKPCIGGGDLLPGRLGLKPKLELRRELCRDFGNSMLAAKLTHCRIERTLSSPHPPEHQAAIARPAVNSLD